jgi:hypothetical protein
MSDISTTSVSPARPVSLFTIVFLFVVFAAFFFAVRYFYQPSAAAPQNVAAENLGKDREWRATTESRRAALKELQEKQAKQVTSYGWVDKNAGAVHLPIERAMELTVQQYGAKK